jgi:tRNA-Thr(GGU) m(6)t(6)A37 methyltransferase TsaA
MEQEETVRFLPIGVVHRKDPDDKIKGDFAGLESEVEVYPQYKDALDGIEGFSHIFVLAYFNKLRPDQIGPLKVKPKRLLKYGLKLEDLPSVGVFTLDSPTRPNPIGLSLARLIRIEEERKLIVQDLEYFDGTPVLDIKPYQPGYRAEQYRLPSWNTELSKKAGLPSTESI